MVDNGKRVAVMIGGTSGLGLGTAAFFASKSIDVIVGGRDQEKLTKAVGIIGQGARGIRVNVSEDLSVQDFFRQVGDFNYLIMTASGTFADKPLAETSIEEFRAFAETKLWGTLRCVREAQQHMAEEASITIVSGAVSRKGRAGAHAKTITNAALEGLTRSLAVELGSRVRVNCISPGMFDSKGTMTIQKKDEIRALYPRRYIGNSRDVAAMIYSVATNAFMTGSVISIDSGWTAA